jgi:hypothetical protein
VMSGEQVDHHRRAAHQIVGHHFGRQSDLEHVLGWDAAKYWATTSHVLLPSATQERTTHGVGAAAMELAKRCSVSSARQLVLASHCPGRVRPVPPQVQGCCKPQQKEGGQQRRGFVGDPGARRNHARLVLWWTQRHRF